MVNTSKNIISIVNFAFVGGILRSIINQWWGDFWGIIAVNLIGSFCLTWLTYYVFKRQLLSSWLNLGLGTGLIGSFTTFGSFSKFTVRLLQTTPVTGLMFMFLNLFGGLLMALCGFELAQWLTRKER